MDEPFLGPCFADCCDVIHRMAERDGFDWGYGRLDARQRLKFLRFERTLDGAQPIRPFRMAERREMFETGGVGDEKSGHLANLGSGRLRRKRMELFRPGSEDSMAMRARRPPRSRRTRLPQRSVRVRLRPRRYFRQRTGLLRAARWR